MPNYCHILLDNTYWSISDAAFVGPSTIDVVANADSRRQELLASVHSMSVGQVLTLDCNLEGLIIGIYNELIADAMNDPNAVSIPTRRYYDVMPWADFVNAGYVADMAPIDSTITDWANGLVTREISDEVTTLCDMDALKEYLKHYGYPMGELVSPDDLVQQFEAAVTRRLDDFAREKQYDNMDKARLASLTADFKADGDCANRLYDQVWTAAFALEDQIRVGALNVDDALAQLPAMIWPAA